jgi:hypothetical protein
MGQARDRSVCHADHLIDPKIMGFIAEHRFDEGRGREDVGRLKQTPPFRRDAVIRNAKAGLDVRDEKISDAVEAADRIKHRYL